ncbi:MAG: translocation/assembly module TamB, partial [Sphingomonadaceae bacterium]
MAVEAELPADDAWPKVQPPRRWPWVAAAILGLLGLLVAALLWFLSETPAGRGIVVSRLLPLVTPQSGLRIEAERIDGSLFAQATLVGVTLVDLDGPFATAPEVQLDWSAAALLRRHVRIRALVIPEASLARTPRLNPADPDDPLLPDIRLTLDRLQVDQLHIAESVAGVEERLRLSARAALADQRALVVLDAGGALGDRLALRLDAAPDRDRLDLALQLDTAANGLLAALAGLDRPVSARVSGAGGWTRWRGSLAADIGDMAAARLVLAADSGRFRATGALAPGAWLGDGIASDLLGPVLT